MKFIRHFKEQNDVRCTKYCRGLTDYKKVKTMFVHRFHILYIFKSFYESNISSCLHFSMQNIEMSCGLDRASKRSNINVSQ